MLSYLARLWRVVTVLALLLFAGCDDRQTVRSSIESAAARLHYLAPEWVIYDRTFHSPGPTDLREDIAIVQGVLHGPVTAQDAIQLLKHRDPRVRTLAIAVLAYRDYPRHLNAIADLLSDGAATVPAPGRVSSVRDFWPQQWPEEPQKVQDLARGVIQEHLHAAGFGPLQYVSNEQMRIDWRNYQETRAQPPYNLEDYRILWARAASTRSPAGRTARTDAVLRGLDSLREPERFIATVVLYQDFAAADAISEEHVIALARRLAPSKRKLLFNEPPARHGKQWERAWLIARGFLVTHGMSDR